jgi:hypothetical protein
MTWNHIDVATGDEPPRRMFFPDFAAANDPSVVADVLEQLRAHGFATLEGGAGPFVRITPAAPYLKRRAPHIEAELDALRRALDVIEREAAALQRADVKGPAWAAACARVSDRHWRVRCAFVELRDAP